ncbi:MAG: aldo/keto reductase [Microgenomates group bacterium]
MDTNKYNRVGLGTFPLSGVYNPISHQQALSLVECFLEQGGYYIDTAPMYGCTQVESLLGAILPKKRRDTFYLVSKCGKEMYPSQHTWEAKAKYADVIKQCDDSLKRLKLDYIDLYLIHSPDKETPFEETLRAMSDLKKSGKIREIGVSNVTLDELKQYRAYADIHYVQNRFSFINRSISPEYSTYLKQNNIFLIPYEVLELGLLTGSVVEEDQLGQHDVRGTTGFFQGDPLAETRNLVKDAVFPLAREYGFTVAQTMIAWTLLQPQVFFPIVGTTKPDYVEINLKAESIELSSDMLQKLDSAYQALVEVVKTKFHTTIKDFRGLNNRYYSDFDFKKYNIF